MPQITKIEKQKKARNRFNIYIDNEFYCGLYDDTILKFGIASGDEINHDKLESIRAFDEYIYGKKIAMDYLSYRIRTVSEIRKKLRSKKINDETAGKIIEHLKELGLLNDEEFARQLITEKIKNKSLSRRMLEQKLFEKGISKQTGQPLLDQLLNAETETTLAFKIYEKLSPKLKGLDKQDAKKKIYETLTRKGFDYDTINTVILKFNTEKAE